MQQKSKKKRDRKKHLIFYIIIGLIFISSVSYVGLYFGFYTPASPQITEHLDTYNYAEEKYWYIFPSNENYENDAIFLFPNPKVDEKAYFHLAADLQERGYNVFVGKSLFHQPILSSNIVSKAKKAYPEQRSWTVGGHLDGKNAVTKHVLKNRASTDNVFYLGAFPTERAVEIGKPILVITGSIHPPLSEAATKIEKLLAEEENVTNYVIEGANDSNFADYGNEVVSADVMSRREQQKITATRIDNFIKIQSGISTKQEQEEQIQQEVI